MPIHFFLIPHWSSVYDLQIYNMVFDTHVRLSVLTKSKIENKTKKKTKKESFYHLEYCLHLHFL